MNGSISEDYVDVFVFGGAYFIAMIGKTSSHFDC
jgi:hypothetical protein